MKHGVFPGIAVLFGTLAVAAEANAQQRPGVDMSTYRPSTDPNASLVLEPAITPGPEVLTLGGYADYAFHPVTLRKPNGDVAYRPVASQLVFTPILNVGVGNRFAFGGSLPIAAYQYGSRSLPASVSDETSTPSAALGDLGVNGKFTILRNEQGGFGLAALANLTIPTGDANGFLGETAPTLSGRILAEYTLLVAMAEASIGYKGRFEHRTWPDVDAGGVRFGDEIPWSVAIGMKPAFLGIDPRNRQRLEVAVHGWLPAAPVGPFGLGDRGSSALSPVQLALSDRIELGHYRDTFLTLGGELGLTSAVGVPVFRAVAAVGWTPRAHDMDNDGVKDDVDGCPQIPEDKDGFEDSDGCPDIDNDQDGILDRDDACPNVAGDPDPDPKKNGCPHEHAPTPPPPPKTEPAVDPNADDDGDTFPNGVDKCPTQPEVFNGVADDDGCPDEGGAPLVTVDEAAKKITLAAPLKFAGTADEPVVDPSSLPTLRALTMELNRRPTWTLAVGAKPTANDAQLAALAKSFAVVKEIADLSHRDGIAETVGWDAVKGQPGAESGVAFLVLASP